jgi:hypothetical protein
MKKNSFFIVALSVLFVVVYVYIFDEKIDLNGDNCIYYMLSTSIAQGLGYCGLEGADAVPTNVYPPGYPLLMSVVRFFSDSIVAQKVLNGLFLLASVLILFGWMKRTGKQASLACVVAASVLFNHFIMRYSTIMMSEMSYLLFSLISLFLLSRLDDKKPFPKDKAFYLLILSAGYAYHIRTQGISLVIAIAVHFLFRKKYLQSAGFVAGFVLVSLPWVVRNRLLGLSTDRYLSRVLSSGEGMDGGSRFISFVEQGFSTLKMLLAKAIPDSVIPFFHVDYNAPVTGWEWLIGIVLLFMIGAGFWQFKRYRMFLFSYLAGSLAIICLWVQPSQNRYIVTMIPLLQMGIMVGLYMSLCFVANKTSLRWKISPWVLSLLFVFSFAHLEEIRETAQHPFPPNYRNYFYIAETFKKQHQTGSTVCSRKPELFRVVAGTPACGYIHSDNHADVIKDMVEKNVDYVILEQLGYRSTYQYLYPAIEAYQDLFRVVMHLQNPDTYLLKFDREKAISNIQSF